jgi:hypothetical protein
MLAAVTAGTARNTISRHADSVESTLAILKGTTPGFPEEGPPWDIEGEPGERWNFNLKRPFKANEGNSVGHIGHYKNEPGCTKFELVQQHHKHQNNHKPLALHLSS